MAAVADKWDVKQMETGDKAWTERTGPEKALFVVIQVLKVIMALGLLYIFLISLSMMGNAFKVIGGPTAGAVFRNNDIFDNPFAGCSLGILATILVQSSSTSTSIIITMTAAGLIDPKNAIYMIMGANIGTSVTNTIVSMSHIGDVDQYRRAFAGATVHDCFNLLTVFIMLPLEYFFHPLYHIGTGLVESAGISDDQEKQDKVDFIKKITKPVTSRLISVDKKLVTKVAEASDQSELDGLLKLSMIKNKQSQDNHMFLDTPMSDEGAGWLLLVISLVMLSTTLILLVKLLQTIFRGRAAIWMQGLLNLEFKNVPFVADYILVLFGVGITILMQSSSITTSTLTPLVGIGLIKLDKMFPFTVGANVGTTVTGILSALASSKIATGMTVAFAHLFFNLIGAAIWFPLPFMRAVPLAMARGLGSVAADWRWFPLAYIFVVFAGIPGLLLALSLMHWAALVLVGLPLLLLLAAASCVFGLRAYHPERLPAALKKDYSFMPPSMRMATEEGAGAGPVEEANVGSADIGGSRQWWLAPCAYGLGWYAILLLLMAVPNAKYSDMKYASFDDREHIGLGAWSACSAMFAEEVDWASSPATGAALEEHLAGCMQGLKDSCGNASDFSSIPGANSEYQDSWQGCTSATTEDWLRGCKALTGCGDLHATQCSNVSAAVSRPYAIDYSQSGTKWAAAPGSSCNLDSLPKACCIPLGDFCTDVGGLTTAGGLGVAGIVFCLLGMVAMLAYLAKGQKRDMRKVLWGSAAAFGVAWVLLLAGWASGLSALGQETTCWVQDDQNDGIVAAKGKLGDIANGASYGLGYIIGAWALLIPILAITALRVVDDAKSGPPLAGKTDGELATETI
jgi:sodium-dependent phosphate cotransporter